MREKIKQKAPKGQLRALLFSNETGECKGFCDFEGDLFLNDFLRPINETLDGPSMSLLSAIVVDEYGFCTHPLAVRAEQRKFVVVSQVPMCENKILTQHETVEVAIAEATTITAERMHTTQGFGGWGVIDDRGILIWGLAHYNKRAA